MAKVRTNRGGDVAAVEGEHSHPPAQGAIDARRLKADMMRRAEEGGAMPRDIVASALQGAPEDTVRSVGNLGPSKRRLRKRGQGAPPSEPRTPADLVAPDAYRELEDGRRFPHHDNGPELAEKPIGRVVVFAPDRMLGALAQSDYLFGAGEFSMKTVPIHQIYTIRAVLSGRSVTAAY